MTHLFTWWDLLWVPLVAFLSFSCGCIVGGEIVAHVGDHETDVPELKD